MSLYKELRRRNVIRVAIAYVIAAWLVMQVADVVLNNIDAPSWLFQVLMLFLAAGLPIAVIFAWAFELTPEGLKREHEVDRGQSIAHKTGRRLDFAIIAVLVVAVGMLLADKFRDDAVPDKSQATADASVAADTGASIAVLPFANMSADANSAYFSDGLADTLLHMLAQIKELRVASRTSSFQFRDKLLDVAVIGEQLNVGTILEGSVQRSGNEIRITAQLIDVETGYHLWSGNYDRELDDVFAIQDEIANEVVSALKVSLLPGYEDTMRQGGTDSVEAYTEVLLAIDELDSYTFDSLNQALGHLQTAVKIDPDYAQAHALIARTYRRLAETGAVSSSIANEAMYRSASKAVELAPTSSHALSAMGIAELRAGNSDAAGDLLQQAIQYGPNNTHAFQDYATYLNANLNPREAIDVLREARRRDPLSTTLLFELSVYSRLVRDFDAAESYHSRISDINPANPYAYAEAARRHGALGNYARALQNWKKASTLDPDDPELVVRVSRYYLILGLYDEARRWADRALEVDPANPMAQVAPIYVDFFERGASRSTSNAARHVLQQAINGEIEDRRNSVLFAAQVLAVGLQKDGEALTEVLEALDSLHPQLFNKPPAGTEKNRDATRIVGQIMLAGGMDEQGNRLLDDWSKEQARRDLVYGPVLSSVTVALARGNVEGALQQLQDLGRWTDSYGFLPHYFEHFPDYRQIVAEPQIKTLISARSAHDEEQRALLAELERDVTAKSVSIRHDLVSARQEL